MSAYWIVAKNPIHADGSVRLGVGGRRGQSGREQNDSERRK
ncbi:hypothetical protein RBSWK_05521 [Rhodopirellula baltica SWK14]|uniref:Uncharacterized protein n=1 Tax=Rhodopirellula baltica SWK14 TaxID=993516 RepID=L7C8R2_RHOBT|nr:hypothetical protein RBSWK_05521 [Rhodopirellula baltica SWK14]